jgi:hypothetical protein
MLKYGAKSVYKLGIGSNDQDDIISYFNTWKTDMWPTLAGAFGAAGYSEKKFDINANIFSGAMDEETPSHLKNDKKPLIYDCIISSFKKESPINELKSDNPKYDFKFKNWLEHDTLRVLNVT